VSARREERRAHTQGQLAAVELAAIPIFWRLSGELGERLHAHLCCDEFPSI
jgi:hypothetical protein